jgi:hypothetical protein
MISNLFSFIYCFIHFNIRKKEKKLLLQKQQTKFNSENKLKLDNKKKLCS